MDQVVAELAEHVAHVHVIRAVQSPSTTPAETEVVLAAAEARIVLGRIRQALAVVESPYLRRPFSKPIVVVGEARG